MKQPIGVITHPGGFRAAGVAAGVKKKTGLRDVAVLVSDATTTSAAVFTTIKVPAAPVQVSREHLAASRGRIRAVVVNSGNANACTGRKGLSNARRMAALGARALGLRDEQVLVGSTGVIGRPLPMDKVEAGIAAAVRELRGDARGGATFLEGIMTTDLFPKEAESSFVVRGKRVRVAGVVKGAGMIAPKMATMLCFVTTDASVSRARLDRLLRSAVGKSFNRITVDSHMSTNDTVLVMANGRSGVDIAGGAAERKFAASLDDVLLTLALKIVRDGEGATRVVEVRVDRAKSDADAELAARSIVNSPLVKTALFGADPNWGRFVSAAAAAGCAFEETKTTLRISGGVIYRRGRPLPVTPAIERAMKQEYVTLALDLGLGRGRSVVYTCDLGYDYVKCNAEYTT